MEVENLFQLPLNFVGYVAMGPYRGGMCSKMTDFEYLYLTDFKGQAQYLRVPYADFNALTLPPGKEHEADFVLLAGKSPLQGRS